MSRLVRAAKRHGKQQMRFQFEMIVRKLSFGAPISMSHKVVWSRGPRSDSTKFVNGQKGVFVFEHKLTILSTLYKDSSTGKFDAKKSKLHIVAEGSSKHVGRVEFDLAQYAQVQGSQECTFPLSKCSDKAARLEVALNCRWLKELRPEDYAPSVMSFSSIGSKISRRSAGSANSAEPPRLQRRNSHDDLGFDAHDLLNDKNAEIEQLRRKVQTLERENKDTWACLEKKVEQIEDQQAQLDDFQDGGSGVKKSAPRNLFLKVPSNANSAQQHQREELEELRAQNKALDAQVASLQSDLSEAERRDDSTGFEIIDAPTQPSSETQDELHSLIQSNRKLAHENKALQKALHKAEKQASKHTKTPTVAIKTASQAPPVVSLAEDIDFDKLARDNKQLMADASKCGELESDRDGLARELAGTKQQLEDLRQMLQGESDLLKSSNARCQVLEDEVSAVNSEAERVQTQFLLCRNKLAEVETFKTEILAQREKHRSERDSAAVAVLKAEHAESVLSNENRLQRAQELLTKQRHQYEGESDQMQADLERYRKKYSQVVQTYESCRSELNRQASAYNTLEVRFVDVKVDLVRRVDEMNDMDKQNNELIDQVHRLLQELHSNNAAPKFSLPKLFSRTKS